MTPVRFLKPDEDKVVDSNERDAQSPQLLGEKIE